MDYYGLRPARTGHHVQTLLTSFSTVCSVHTTGELHKQRQTTPTDSSSTDDNDGAAAGTAAVAVLRNCHRTDC